MRKISLATGGVEVGANDCGGFAKRKLLVSVADAIGASAGYGGGQRHAGVGRAKRLVLSDEHYFSLLDEMSGCVLKPIESVQIGDTVWARDEKTGELVKRRVKQLFRHKNKPVFVVTCCTPDGCEERVQGTEEHPFWVKGRGWVALNRLSVGDRVLLRNGDEMIVREVANTGTTADVFNFEVDEIHNYFVGTAGILVHNMSTISQPLQLGPTPIAEGGRARVYAVEGDPGRIALHDRRDRAGRPPMYLAMRDAVTREYMDAGYPVARTFGLRDATGVEGVTKVLEMERYVGVSSQSPGFHESFTPETSGRIRALIQSFKDKNQNPFQLELMVLTEAAHGRQVGDVVVIDAEALQTGPFRHEVELNGYIKRYEEYAKRPIKPFGMCFVAGTRIHIKGGLKAIEEILLGETVIAFDHQTGSLVEQRVLELFTRTHQPVFDVVCEDGAGNAEIITGTAEHPFWVIGKGWVPLSRLDIDCQLLGIDGVARSVLKIQKEPRYADVFNFEVEGHHNYFVGTAGVLVHNMSVSRAGKFDYGKGAIDAAGLPHEITLSQLDTKNPIASGAEVILYRIKDRQDWGVLKLKHNTAPERFRLRTRMESAQQAAEWGIPHVPVYGPINVGNSRGLYTPIFVDVHAIDAYDASASGPHSARYSPKTLVTLEKLRNVLYAPGNENLGLFDPQALLMRDGTLLLNDLRFVRNHPGYEQIHSGLFGTENGDIREYSLRWIRRLSEAVVNAGNRR